jgi:hypothetical protein
VRWRGASAEAFAAGLGPPFAAGIGAAVWRQSFSTELLHVKPTVPIQRPLRQQLGEAVHDLPG